MDSLSSAVPLGSELSCTTTQGDTLRGNVVATDEQLKAVVIRESSDGSNVHIINLNHVADLKILSQPSEPSDAPHLPEINLLKVLKRLDQSVETQWKEVNSRGVNVSEEAQELFDSIRKIYDDIRWDGSDIVVLEDVQISPPYSPENCTGSSTAVGAVQKLVTKFYEDKKSA